MRWSSNKYAIQQILCLGGCICSAEMKLVESGGSVVVVVAGKPIFFFKSSSNLSILKQRHASDSDMTQTRVRELPVEYGPCFSSFLDSLDKKYFNVVPYHPIDDML